MLNFFKTYLTLFVLIFCGLSGYTQTIIKGTVSDASTGEPLPYVNVIVFGSSQGTMTDFDGRFNLTLTQASDSFFVTYIGYINIGFKIQRNQVNTYEILMQPDDNMLGVVEIRPGENPALRIIKNAQRNRSEYNIDKLSYYEFESYNKVQLAVDNISDRFKKRKIFQAMEPLFDTISVLTPDSTVPVLPVFVSETLSDYYFKKSPRRTKEVIHASKVSGVGVGEDSYVSQLLGSTFQQYNFYDNNLYILDKDFISPISAQAQVYYDYRLVDSMYIGKDWCYQIRVFPKNKYDLVFSGMIWITDSTYALKQLTLEITKEANINFIEKLKIHQELVEAAPGAWIPSRLRVLIDIAEVTDNTLGMVGMYYSSNKNIVAEKEHELKFYDEKVSMDINARDFNETFWDTSRHEQVSASDLRIYKMVDSLKNQPIIKTYVDLVEIIVEGYKPMGKIEVGAYYYLLGYNAMEGVRTRVGFRTTQEFSDKWFCRVYGAYGLKDQKYKYGVKLSYIVSKTHWTKLGLTAKSDVELIGLTDKDYGTSALYDAFALLGTNRINRSKSYQFWVEHELFKGYTQRVFLGTRNLTFEKVGNFNFLYYTQPEMGGASPVSRQFNLTTITLEGRLSHKEQLVVRKHERVSLGNLKAPVVTLGFTKGIAGVLNGDFQFEKYSIHVWQFNSLANLGTFEYNFWVGKTMGTLPYPVLEVMRGNQGYFSNKTFYNLMNYYEFVADQYIAGHYEHQFNGLIMNRIPLMRKLKWRSFFNVKAVYGSLSKANYNLIPKFDTEGNSVTPIGQFGNKPYVELGYGIENIFRCLRVDFIHRLTYLDNPKAHPFGVKATMVFRF
ncbi:MAG: carboxypeptidase-like regulatory domain-containing protein [Bacteroidetes bacterium]|nr:carboxypeptidase-like regulatory domain-containing protein [Bacteroidota bacterium]